MKDINAAVVKELQRIAGEIMQLAGAMLTEETSSLERSEPVADQERTQESRPSADTTAPGSGPVLAEAGHVSKCSACKRAVYEVVNTVRGRGMGIDAFMRAFKALNGAPALSRDMLEVVKDKRGRALMDCPLCKGDKTLVLLGDVDDEPDTPATPGSIPSSIVV